MTSDVITARYSVEPSLTSIERSVAKVSIGSCNHCAILDRVKTPVFKSEVRPVRSESKSCEAVLRLNLLVLLSSSLRLSNIFAWRILRIILAALQLEIITKPTALFLVLFFNGFFDLIFLLLFLGLERD